MQADLACFDPIAEPDRAGSDPLPHPALPTATTPANTSGVAPAPATSFFLLDLDTEPGTATTVGRGAATTSRDAARVTGGESSGEFSQPSSLPGPDPASQTDLPSGYFFTELLEGEQPAGPVARAGGEAKDDKMGGAAFLLGSEVRSRDCVPDLQVGGEPMKSIMDIDIEENSDFQGNTEVPQDSFNTEVEPFGGAGGREQDETMIKVLDNADRPDSGADSAELAAQLKPVFEMCGPDSAEQAPDTNIYNGIMCTSLLV